MERRSSIPHSQPSWLYLTNRQIAAGDHLGKLKHAPVPILPTLTRRAVRKYVLSTPAAATPWAGTMADNSLAALLGADDLGRTALALYQASLQPRSYETYASTLSSFFRFCQEQHLPPSTPHQFTSLGMWPGWVSKALWQQQASSPTCQPSTGS